MRRGGGGGGGDTTAPAVSSTTPAADATGVAVNAAITATFSEKIDASTITTSTFSLNNSVTGAVTYDSTNNIATFTPSTKLAYDTTYTATITTGVKDAAGNALAADYTWSFTTGTAADTTAPTVTATNPANNATNAAVNASITATFSEDVVSASVNSNTFTLTCSATTVMGTVAYDSSTRTATFTPIVVLPASTDCSATITMGVEDLAGHPMAANYQWSFTTSSAAVVTTLAGTALSTGSTDGTGSAARFYHPEGITTDGTNLFVVDCSNSTIRKIVISTGAVTTLAGTAGLNWVD